MPEIFSRQMGEIIMWTRRELKQNAKEALKRNYWKAVLVSLILIMLGGGISPAAASSGSTVDADKYELIQTVVSSDNDGDNPKQEVLEQDYIVAPAIAQESNSAISAVVSELNEADAVVFTAAMAAFIIIVLAAIAIMLAFAILVTNPLWVGAHRFMLKSVDGNGNISELGYTFDHAYLNGVKTMFMRELFVFLWAILFIIPGIYKKYQYYMVEYILAENPEMPYKEVLKLSREMMEGHKWNTFVLDLSFILWHMLSVLTCGLSEILYVQPYINLTRASLYRALCQNRLCLEDIDS